MTTSEMRAVLHLLCVRTDFASETSKMKIDVEVAYYILNGLLFAAAVCQLFASKNGGLIAVLQKRMAFLKVAVFWACSQKLVYAGSIQPPKLSAHPTDNAMLIDIFPDLIRIF